MKLHNYIIALIFSLFLISCGELPAPEASALQVDRVSYFAGKKLYETHCSSCHQENGLGYQSIYPPLAGSDYLLQDTERACRIIKHGIEGPIIVNGRSYDFNMPQSEHLNNEDIANIITYITNAWGNQGVNMTTKDVKKALDSN